MAVPGLVTNKLTILIDGIEVAAEVSKAIVLAGSKDAGFVSFAEAGSGGAREYKLALTFVQLAELWKLVWEHAGSEKEVLVRPWGNAVPTASEPHFSGTVVITEPDGALVGGEADASSSSRFVNEIEWMFTDRPTRITA